MALPSTIVGFKSLRTQQYMRYGFSLDHGAPTDGRIRVFADTPTDPLSQFQVVYAETGFEGPFVHVLSRYTNKYFVSWSPNENWITADAHEKNEDRNNWGCTLFEPIFVHDDKAKAVGVRLRHVQLNKFLRFSTRGGNYYLCLYAGSEFIDPEQNDIFTVTEWEAIHKLPRTVAFKGDNNKYLGACLIRGKHLLQYAYDHPNDKEVVQEVYNNPDGTVMIKSKLYGKFWRRGDDGYINVDLNEPFTPSSNVDAMFRINVINSDVVTLLNMTSTLHCVRFSVPDPHDYVDLLNTADVNWGKNRFLEVTTLKQ